MISSKKLALCYQTACLQELQALKPGNVHIFSAGHDMDVMDFIHSAEVSAKPITEKKFSVGERINHAVRATNTKVNMNTNLGIILLCAPIIHAYLQAKTNELGHVKEALNKTLTSLTVKDAVLVSEAIVLANPAGLNISKAHDVNKKPNVSLYDMMGYAQDRDRVAWQYANQFSDIVDLGHTWYRQAMQEWGDALWATTWVYINYLSSNLDTHIVRKYGKGMAQTVLDEAQLMQLKISTAGHPKRLKQELLKWDASLKERKVNPGTCADLTVATLLISALC